MIDRVGTADILVIDDEASIRRCLSLFLEQKGYAVTTADDGREALIALCSGAALPRLIILDLALPGMDGCQFLLARRSHHHLERVPVFVFSGVSECADIDPRALGAEAVLEEPTDLHKLLDLVDAYISMGAPAVRSGILPTCRAAS